MTPNHSPRFSLASRNAALLALCLAVAAPVLAPEPARAERRTVAEQLLGGSFFPFARSFRKPSERCIKVARRMRAQDDRNVIDSQQRLRLRRIGCGGAWAFY